MLHFLGSIEPHLGVFLATFIPFLETRAAVTLGLVVYHLSPLTTIGLATLASFVIPVIVLPLLGTLIAWMRTWHNQIDHYLDKFLNHKLRHHSGSFDRWGALALFAYVAIPLPLTGAWSASILAYLFGVKFWPAVIAITLGAAASSILVAAGILGGLRLFA